MEYSPEQLALWHRYKRDHPPGTWVTGIVALVRPYGVWVDIGLPSHALLEIPYIARHQPGERGPLRAEEWPVVGHHIKVMICHYGDDVAGNGVIPGFADPHAVGKIGLTQDPSALE